MGAAVEPEWRESSFRRMDDGFRSKKDRTVSRTSERPNRPRVREAKEKGQSKERPLQENTISRSSLKPEETKRGRVAHQKAEDASDALRKGSPQSPEDKRESSQSRSPSLKRENPSRGPKGARDFSDCNGHDKVPCQSLEPRAKKIKLETEEDACKTAEDNNPVPRQQAKKASVSSELETDAPSSLEQEDLKAVEKTKTEKKKQKRLEKTGKEGRKSPVKAEPDSGSEDANRESGSEEGAGRVVEEEQGVGRMLGIPCKVGPQEEEEEQESEGKKPKKRKTSKAEPAEEAESRRGGKKAKKGSQKRKARDCGGKGGKKKRPKKEERESGTSCVEEEGKWKW
ncbi:UNVERIFIED_CONTAM: hypothetical protein K2H54_006214 [Gekko kuhli]